MVYLGLGAAATVLLRIVFISRTFLLEDETYYYLWTKHLSHGYVDHGPFLAWFLKISSVLFGESAFGIRALGLISFLCLSAALYAFGKDIGSRRTGLLLVIAFNLTPFFTGASIIMTTDTPMLLFLFLSVWMYYRGFFFNKKYLYLGGVLLGLAALSKVGSVFVGIGLFLYPFLSNERKRLLQMKELWISFLLAALVYSPFIIWNLQNDFAFVKLATGSLLSRKGGIVRFLEFWLAQAGLFTPLLFGVGMFAVFRVAWGRLRSGGEDDRKIFLAMTSLVPMIYIVHKSFRNKLEANWGAFAFVGLTLLAVMHFSERWDRRKTRIAYMLNFGFGGVFIFLVGIQTLFPTIPLPSRADATRRYYRSSVFAGEFKEYYQNEMRKDVRIFGPNYQIPSMVNFYTEPELEAVCLSLGGYHATSFDFWYKDDTFIGQDFYFLSWRGPGKKVKDRFDRVEFIRHFNAMRGTDRVSRYSLYFCENYRGNGEEH